MMIYAVSRERKQKIMLFKPFSVSRDGRQKKYETGWLMVEDSFYEIFPEIIKLCTNDTQTI